MSKVCFLGDHADYHAGSAAVSNFIRSKLKQDGHEFVDRIVESDILLVNGEGSMHHLSVHFHRKMRALLRAQQLQKKTFLVNSVWQGNGQKYLQVLKKLDGFCVRGVCSQIAVSRDLGIDVPYYLDFSYFDEIDETEKVIDFGGAVVMTDFWVSPEIQFAWLNSPSFEKFKKIDLRDFTWSSLVKSLRTASLLLTGRHHGMYAACKAEIPFVCMRGNSHKIEDLLTSARARIPIGETIGELLSIINWAKRRPTAYQDLFDWMRDQSKWQGIDKLPVRPKVSRKNLWAPAPKTSARLEEFRGAFGLASESWMKVAGESRDSVARRDALVSSLRCAQKNQDLSAGIYIYGKLLSEKDGAEFAASGIGSFRELVNDADAWDGHTKSVPAVCEAKLSDLSKSLITCSNLHDLNQKVELFEEIEVATETLAELLGRPSLAKLLILSAFAGLQNSKRLVGGKEFFSHLHYKYHQQGLEITEGYRELVSNVWPRYIGFRKILESHILSWETGKKNPADLVRISNLIGKCEVDHQEKANWLVEQCATFEIGVEDRSRIAMRLFELGNVTLAREVLVGCSEDWKKQAEKSMILAYLAFNYLDGLSSTAIRNSNLYLDYLNRLTKVREWLSDRNNTVAVVGNSPCEIGRRLGREIDAYDMVIRFNQYSVKPPFDIDYGSRTTIAVLNVQVDEQTNWSLFEKKSLIKMINPWEVLLGDSPLCGPRKACFLQENVTFFPTDQKLVAGRYMDQGISSGLAFSMWLKELRGSLNRKDFFGFSFTDQVESSQAHYFDDQRPSITHDWFRERDLFEGLFEA